MDRHLDKITVYALPAIVQNKRKKEQIVEEITKPIYEDLIRRIKESDDWFTLIYSKEKNTLKVREMQHVVYKLHKHPNIISKLMMTDPSGKHPLAVKMRPFAFKWVNESEKKELVEDVGKEINGIERKIRDYYGNKRLPDKNRKRSSEAVHKKLRDSI